VSQNAAQPLAPAPANLQPGAMGAGGALTARVLGSTRDTRSLLSEIRRARARNRNSIVVFGEESKFRAASDAASLLRKSSSALGIATQRRNAITTDPRIRGGRIGQLIASGSYWFPARQDLDTLISKIDSRIVSDMIIVRGPYSALYGPGFDFVDIELLGTPRYATPETHGNSSLEYHTNGERWYGRQSIFGGQEDFGYRVSYGHRTGVDYADGDGNKFPGSHKSRDLDVALGWDLDDDTNLEFNYLRLDQTDTEFPGQILDIDLLKTNAYEATLIKENLGEIDRWTLEGWYITNDLKGSGVSPAKRQLHPLLANIGFSAVSDVENVSSGFSSAMEWHDGCAEHTLGIDLRHLTQSIDQFQTAAFFAPNTNFPLPKAEWINPGIFYERYNEVNDQFSVRIGGRIDLVDSNARDNAASTNLQQSSVLTGILTDNLEQVLEGDFNQHFTLGQAFITTEYQMDDYWRANTGLGFGMRAPTMTELYAVGPLLSILPQFLPNIMIGNPRLTSEKRYQADLGLSGEFENFSLGVNGFYALVQDYITLEFFNPPGGVQFAWTNTDLASLSGIDLYSEWEANDWLSTFGTVSYVYGYDHTRNSNAVLNGNNTTQFRGQVDRDGESLQGISPLESRLGVRVKDPSEDSRWLIEFSSRLVGRQNLVAQSLRELSTDEFATFDLRAFWQATDNLTLTGGVENLTDNQYREHFDSRQQDVFVGGGTVNIGGTGNVFQPGISFYFGSELRY